MFHTNYLHHKDAVDTFMCYYNQRMVPIIPYQGTPLGAARPMISLVTL